MMYDDACTKQFDFVQYKLAITPITHMVHIMQNLQPILQNLHATHAAVIHGDNPTNAQRAAFDAAWDTFAEALANQLREWHPEKAANFTREQIIDITAEMGGERIPGCPNPTYCQFEAGVYTGEVINEATRRAYIQ